MNAADSRVFRREHYWDAARRATLANKNRHGQAKPISPQSLKLTPTNDSGVESLMEHLITMDVVETIAGER